MRCEREVGKGGSWSELGNEERVYVFCWAFRPPCVEGACNLGDVYIKSKVLYSGCLVGEV